MEALTKLLSNFRRDPATSLCGLAFLISYYVSSEPASVAFLGPEIANFIVGLAGFVKGLSVAAGLLFAAQSRPETLVEKDVIKEVLTENQPEGKKVLMSDEPDAKSTNVSHTRPNKD